MATSANSGTFGDQEPLVLHTSGGEMPDIDSVERRLGQVSDDLLQERARERMEEVTAKTKDFFSRPAVWLPLGAVSLAAAIYLFVTSRRFRDGRHEGDEFFEIA